MTQIRPNLCLAEGDFYAWGSGESWQLGNGERDVKSSPILNSIPGEKVQDITAGGTSSVAITGEFRRISPELTGSESGNIYSWGLGMCGRLGHGTTEDSPLPKRMEFWDQIDSKVVKICGKGGHNVAMTGKTSCDSKLTIPRKRGAIFVGIRRRWQIRPRERR